MLRLKSDTSFYAMIHFEWKWFKIFTYTSIFNFILVCGPETAIPFTVYMIGPRNWIDGHSLYNKAHENKTILFLPFLNVLLFLKDITDVLFGGFYECVPSWCAVVLGDGDWCRGTKIRTVRGGHGNTWLLDIHKFCVHDLAVNLHHGNQVFVSVVTVLPFRS